MTGHRVLVVEDDAAVRSRLSRGLGEAGFEIVAVGDGSAALGHAGERPDALVIDLGLPDADGRDVYLALQAARALSPSDDRHRAGRRLTGSTRHTSDRSSTSRGDPRYAPREERSRPDVPRPARPRIRPTS